MPIKEAFRAKMNEEITEALAVSNGHDIGLTVKPFQVVTLIVSL
jgi:hypothetical protein